ncbi:PadR family transcriptional regulator [Pseudonocardia sp. CA-142604]|uniref:PadR family transcriptional regulator n=1 Tax=Pseudonocardia sp. CA-142604 TaxID=3240024 RepID=UPI003D950275
MILSRSDRDLPALSVLGLLLSGPQYTFEIYRTVVDREMRFLTGLPRTLYHAVDRLARGGLIEVVGYERTGIRPERTIFAITNAGRDDLIGRVRRLLAYPEPDADLFVAALSFYDCLPPSVARAALRARHDELERLLAERRCLHGAAPEVLRVGIDYGITRLDAERVWVARLIGALGAGRMSETGSAS